MTSRYYLSHPIQFRVRRRYNRIQQFIQSSVHLLSRKTQLKKLHTKVICDRSLENNFVEICNQYNRTLGKARYRSYSLKVIRLVFWFLTLLCVQLPTVAQADNYKDQRANLAIYNIGFNGLIGGIGSLINQRGDKADFNTFLKGFYKGAIGGSISHIGLSMTHQIDKREEMLWAWPARLVNSLGSSIIQNAAEDRRMLERLSFNLFFTRLEYNGVNKRFKARFFTSSLYGFINVGKGARFDLVTSLKTGIFYFESDNRFSIAGGNSGRATGQVSSIGMASDLEGAQFYNVYAEEVAHILQYDRKVGGNALLYRPDIKWKANSKFYRNVAKYVHFDLNGPVFWFVYQIQNGSDCDNFYEKEARNYSGKRFEGCNYFW